MRLDSHGVVVCLGNNVLSVELTASGESFVDEVLVVFEVNSSDLGVALVDDDVEYSVVFKVHSINIGVASVDKVKDSVDIVLISV
jgi:hypothetical protein